jgi:hypothetical protein
VEAAGAEADNADICTVKQKPSNAAIDDVSGVGWASLVGGLCPHTLHKDFEGVCSFVMIDGDFC